MFRLRDRNHGLRAPAGPRKRTRRRGIALVNALIFALLAAFMFAVGVQFTTSALRQGRTTKADAQVYNVALAGITAATNWLQKQNTQPVLCFDPQANTNSPDDDPETPAAEEQLGLVNEFVVDSQSNLWGRYEVGRSTTGPIPAPARSPLTQTGAHSALYNPDPTWTAEDISKQRGASAGTIWRVRCRAYLFTRTNPATPFSLTNPAPIQTMTLECEIRRGKFNYHEAALYNYYTNNGPHKNNNTNICYHYHDASSNCVIASQDGSGYSIWSDTSSVGTSGGDGAPTLTAMLTGCNNAAQPTYVSTVLGDQLQYYFGVPDLATFKGMADEYYEDPNNIPQPMHQNKIVYINVHGNGGAITFDDQTTLNGSGVLVINGDVTVDGSQAAQSFNGLMFVTGQYEQTHQSTITGALVTGDSVLVHGYDTGPNHPAKIYYSPSTLDAINATVGTYRMMRSTIRAVNDATAPTY